MKNYLMILLLACTALAQGMQELLNNSEQGTQKTSHQVTTIYMEDDNALRPFINPENHNVVMLAKKPSCVGENDDKEQMSQLLMMAKEVTKEYPAKSMLVGFNHPIKNKSLGIMLYNAIAPEIVGIINGLYNPSVHAKFKDTKDTILWLSSTNYQRNEQKILYIAEIINEFDKEEPTGNNKQKVISSICSALEQEESKIAL